MIATLQSSQGRDLDCLKKTIQNVLHTGSPALIRKLIDEKYDLQNLEQDLLQCNLRNVNEHVDWDEKHINTYWFEITNKLERSNLYTHSTTRQPFHTDNAWFSSPPEINIFVMLRQAKIGGEQVFLEVKDLIKDLTLRRPKLLQELVETPVIISKGTKEITTNYTSIIKLDSTPRIYWNYYRTQRSNPQVEHLIEQFFAYLEEIWSTSLVTKVKMQPGDVLIFNDSKSLHGRESFQATYDGERSLLQAMFTFCEE